MNFRASNLQDSLVNKIWHESFFDCQHLQNDLNLDIQLRSLQILPSWALSWSHHSIKQALLKNINYSPQPH